MEPIDTPTTVFFNNDENCSLPNASGYTPIDCSQYDYLEMWAIKGKNLNLTTKDRLNIERVRIIDLRIIEGIKYLLTDQEHQLRLDTIDYIKT